MVMGWGSRWWKAFRAERRKGSWDRSGANVREHSGFGDMSGWGQMMQGCAKKFNLFSQNQ